MSSRCHVVFDSPIGALTAVADDGVLCALGLLY